MPARFRSPRRLTRYPADGVGEARYRFVTAVSHELRTPLAQIRLMGETLLLGRAAPEDATRWLRTIVREAQRLDDRIHNVLRYAHADGAGARFRHEDVDLAALAAEVGAAAAGTGQIRIEIEPAGVRGDREALRLALVNLVDNALRHGPPGHDVTITVRPVGGCAVMAVTDRGPGMSPGPASGVGLGLAVVRRIAADHGGTVLLDTPPAGGNRVGLRLPLATSA